MDEKDNKEIKKDHKKEEVKPEESSTNPEKKSNTPVIIAAIISGLLVLAAVILIIVFGRKVEIETPNPGVQADVNSFEIGSFSEYHQTYGLNKAIIKNTDDLEDFYTRLVEIKVERKTSTYDKNAPLRELTYCDYLKQSNREDEYAKECEQGSSSEETLTYCDWLEIYGDEEDYKGGCDVERPTRRDYSWMRWSYCKGDLVFDAQPNSDADPGISCDNYLEDFLDYYGFELPSKKLDNDYFKNHDLLVFLFDDEGVCGQSFEKVSKLTKNDDEVRITIDYYRPSHSGDCNTSQDIILIELEKDYISSSDSIVYDYNNTYYSNIECPSGWTTRYGTCVPPADEKPMIYLYPEQEEKITVKLGRPERLTTTYPKYNTETGWQVIARPDGTLKELGSSREYYGLYWEGISSLEEKEDGFIVAGEGTIDFLEEKLEILGLSEREANEFIVYWLPKMEHNNYNYIHFATSEEINTEMPLDISPAPKTLIRVLMEFKPLDEKIEVKEQKLEKVERKGYTVVEWGGTELK